jgi:hypothetical protein
MMERIKNNNKIISNNARLFDHRTAASIAQREVSSVFQAIAVLADDGKVSVQTVAKKHSASLVGQNPHNQTYFKNTGTVGYEAVLRPFSTEVAGSGGALAKYESPVSGAVITNTDLNPYKVGTDIHWVANGDTFSGNYTGKGTAKHDKMRPLALRGPLTLAGWGYDIGGKPVPNSNTSSSAKMQDMTTSFLADHLKKSNKWKVGQVDLRWNPINKTWISPGTVIMGTYKGSGNVELEGFAGYTLKIDDPNYLGTEPESGKKVACGFYPMKNKWYLIAVEC